MRRFKSPIGYEKVGLFEYLLAFIYIGLIMCVIFGFVFGAIWLAVELS